MVDLISHFPWIVIVGAAFVVWGLIDAWRTGKANTERVQAAEKRVDESPGKSKFAWDLARITLESYFDRNLRQVSAIFWLSVFVMLIGVGIILWGITIAVQAKDNATSLAAIITGASGVITELIGATFLSFTVQQCNRLTITRGRWNALTLSECQCKFWIQSQVAMLLIVQRTKQRQS